MLNEEWVVDEIPNSSGFYTIRLKLDDGSMDTESQPIATVFEYEDAKKIVKGHELLRYFCKKD